VYSSLGRAQQILIERILKKKGFNEAETKLTEIRTKN
jgi:hypothetical protein